MKLGLARGMALGTGRKPAHRGRVFGNFWGGCNIVVTCGDKKVAGSGRKWPGRRLSVGGEKCIWPFRINGGRGLVGLVEMWWSGNENPPPDSGAGGIGF